jgi:hypothetical protein
MNYMVHCFTEKTVGSEFPENTYIADDLQQVTKIIDDVSREISGIKLVQVYINH